MDVSSKKQQEVVDIITKVLPMFIKEAGIREDTYRSGVYKLQYGSPLGEGCSLFDLYEEDVMLLVSVSRRTRPWLSTVGLALRRALSNLLPDALVRSHP